MNVAECWAVLETNALELSDHNKVVLACFSCSRCAAAFDQYCAVEQCSDRSVCRAVVEAGWKSLSQDPEISTVELMTRLEAQASQCESTETDISGAGAEACFACMVLLELLEKRQHENVIRIIRFARDITDLFVQEDPQLESGADLEAAVLRHPLMKQELSLHRKAVELLQQGKVDLAMVKNLANLPFILDGFEDFEHS